MGFRYIYKFFFLVFWVFFTLVLWCWIFFFFCGFGCDCGLWLKWRFGGYVGGGLVAMVVVVVAVSYVGGCGCVELVVIMGYDCGCVGGGLNYYFFLVVGYGCHMEVVASEVVMEVVVAG